MRKGKILLGVCGGIAAYKAAELIEGLKRKNEIKVVMTNNSTRFITPLTLQTLSGNPVYSEMFTLPKEWEIAHISLAKWADLLLVVPATANIIGKAASGIADDLLSTVIMASTSPVLFAPAMNKNMWKNHILQENIKRLKKIGYHFIEPTRGILANGQVGIGHLAPVETIIKEVKKRLNET
ncbi:MAG: hypothetical protein KAX20_04705 [Candidatus Omnitrophica bacterium]|nr:hypothetical protein [Candidatus Omnitrophota bacterium]